MNSFDLCFSCSSLNFRWLLSAILHRNLGSLHIIDSPTCIKAPLFAISWCLWRIILDCTRTFVHCFHVFISIVRSSKGIYRRLWTPSRLRSLYNVHAHFPIYTILLERRYWTYLSHVFFFNAFMSCIYDNWLFADDFYDFSRCSVQIICSPFGRFRAIFSFFK